jgi:chaperonin GroEL (HSP60 family)
VDEVVSEVAHQEDGGQDEGRESDYDREKLQERLAKLVGGVAVIKVGAATETEMKEKKARVEDANARHQGGGRGRHRAGRRRGTPARVEVLAHLKLGGDQQIGVNIVARAIEEPMRWIASNAGQEGSIVVQKVREMKDDEGFNALTDTYENLVKVGVIDPAKVVRSALQNASSIASLLLTTARKYVEQAAPPRCKVLLSASRSPASWPRFGRELTGPSMDRSLMVGSLFRRGAVCQCQTSHRRQSPRRRLHPRRSLG